MIYIEKCPLTVSIHTEWTNYINNKSTSTYFIKNVVGWETNWRNKLLVYIPNFYFFHLLRMVCIFLIWFMRYWCKTLQEGLYDRVAFFVVITRINFWQVFQSITRKLFWIFDFWNTTNAQSFSNSFFELLRNFFQLWDNIFLFVKNNCIITFELFDFVNRNIDPINDINNFYCIFFHFVSCKMSMAPWIFVNISPSTDLPLLGPVFLPRFPVIFVI